MNARLLFIMLCAALAACASNPMPLPRFTAPAVPSQCAAQCYETCKPATWPQWQCDNPDTPECWDVKDEQITAPLRELVETCDAKRAACVSCLERLDRVGLTCGTATPCQGESK